MSEPFPVVAVFSGADLMEIQKPLAPKVMHPKLKDLPRYPMPPEEVHFVGEPVAIVVAESRYIAEDALELIDVDWEVPTHEMRTELRAIVEGTDLWDERACVLQVTDAINGMVRVRALVTAKDAPTLFDLRCHVRERLVEWLRENYPDALPRTRADVTGLPGHRIEQLPADS